MTKDRGANNRLILIVDDNVNIHEDFRKILSPPIESGALDHTRAALFGEAPTIPAPVSYELEFATQGPASTIEHCVQDLLSLIKDMREFLVGQRHETGARDHS